MKEWLDLNIDTKRLEKTKTIRGVQFTLQVSPFNVPVAVRGYFAEAIKRFVIEFRYIGDEPKHENAIDQYVTLIIGKNSSRLHGIQIDVKALEASAVQLRIEVLHKVEEALENLISDSHDKIQLLDNYRMAKDAISTTGDVLFSSFAHN